MFDEVRFVVMQFVACLAQSVERQALNLMVVGSSPTVGVCVIAVFRFLAVEIVRFANFIISRDSSVGRASD